MRPGQPGLTRFWREGAVAHTVVIRPALLPRVSDKPLEAGFQLLPRPADIDEVRLVLGIPSLLVVLVIGGYLMTKEMRSNGPSSPPVQQAVAQAQSAVAETNFSQANASMQAFFTQRETYLGAALPAGSGVVLVTATPTSYCLQAADEHEDGPGGTVLPGGC